MHALTRSGGRAEHAELRVPVRGTRWCCVHLVAQADLHAAVGYRRGVSTPCGSWFAWADLGIQARTRSAWETWQHAGLRAHAAVLVVWPACRCQLPAGTARATCAAMRAGTAVRTGVPARHSWCPDTSEWPCLAPVMAAPGDHMAVSDLRDDELVQVPCSGGCWPCGHWEPARSPGWRGARLTPLHGRRVGILVVSTQALSMPKGGAPTGWDTPPDMAQLFDCWW